MATKYTLHFSDTGKTPFELQSYTTNGPVSPSDPSPTAGSSGNIETTLKLYGKGNKDYGEPVFQDLLYMLENFSNTTRPVFSIEGQLWYNNRTFVAGSPPTQPELFIRNANAADTFCGSPFTADGWDAVILATGASAMQTGAELILGTNPTSPLGAVTKQYADVHINSTDLHLSPDQNIFLDGLTLGSPLLTSSDVNQLIGISHAQTVQTQLDDKLSRSVNENMNLNIDLTFNGGEPRGLPTVPTAPDSATSMQYVDDQIALGVAASGDGVLTSTSWQNTGLGSPLPNTSETTLRLTITNAGSPVTTTDIDVLGISRYGHLHQATEVFIDNSFDVTYGANVQTAIEQAAAEIDLLKTGGAAPTATIAVQRIFEILAAPLTVAGSPIDIFATQNHTTDDNRVALTINGVKQYAHTRGTQGINYSTTIDAAATTGLDGGTIYDFNIAVDGGSITTITVNPAGSPAVDISTHGALVIAINAQLAGSPVVAATFSIDSLLSEIFTSHTSSTGSAISITDPGGSPNVYLFAAGSPLGLDNLDSVGTPVTGVDGDYMETDNLGIQALPADPTSYVVFNYDIITGSKIESLLYV